jgi:protein-disulfide isomerase
MRFLREGWIVALAVLIAAGGVAQAAGEGVVARIGEEQITLEQLEKDVRAQLIEIDNARYEALKNGLDRMIADRIIKTEAEARGVTVEALLDSEVKSKLTTPSEEEVVSVYEANKSDLGEATLEQVRPQIVQFLTQRQEALATRGFVDQLRAKYKPQVLLAAPKVEVGTGSLEPRGPAGAPITLVVFSDYECPYCKRAENTLEDVLNAYPDKIRVYHRDFPLEFHAQARPAAIAARCANEQGKFWPYRRALYTSADLSADRFKEIADQTGLDRAKFDECVASNKFDAAIAKDIDDGADVGVNGTPAFFVNGRVLSGAQPLDAFKSAIDAELAAASTK